MLTTNILWEKNTQELCPLLSGSSSAAQKQKRREWPKACESATIYRNRMKWLIKDKYEEGRNLSTG
jgi:hypothetical protein